MFILPMHGITLMIVTSNISQRNTKGTKFTQNTVIHYIIVFVCLSFSLSCNESSVPTVSSGTGPRFNAETH
jgi:hypothetical protein